MRKMMLRVSRFAPVALVAAGALLFAGEAWADRACDAANPLLRCPVLECIALLADVNSICKTPAPQACRNVSGCFALRQERQHWLDCYTARTIMNDRCWGGGDPGHQERAADAIKQVGACDRLIAMPEPQGCADPCSGN
ncbi:MAG TPA: hypothetical protein VLB76_12520 [Thermoanaerobaculia bacterium]|jgi:hypothetical protein|nr:hypothetical protein [Thermoanaerobaculia bacterium]